LRNHWGPQRGRFKTRWKAKELKKFPKKITPLWGAAIRDNHGRGTTQEWAPHREGNRSATKTYGGL